MKNKLITKVARGTKAAKSAAKYAPARMFSSNGAPARAHHWGKMELFGVPFSGAVCSGAGAAAY